ncbi:MAG: HDOD domain-containing protein [Fibrobacteria bacterium]|nr:HDOD domain-containing protein [Fibrobacteria bacterium]
MEDTLKHLKDITNKLSDLPTLPTVVSQITQLMQNPRTSAAEVGEAITTDQSLTSKTLKLVNSAFYGFPGRIKTITHAIVILGFTTVKNIVLTASILNVIGKTGKSKEFDQEAFWLHSVSTGAIAKVLAELYKHKISEEAFIGGLLHDLGKVIINHCVVDLFEEVLIYRDKHNCLLKDAEKGVLKVTHQEIGSWVAERWKLPSNLTAVIQYHHNPELAGDYKEITGLVHLADIFARALGSGSGGDNSIPIVSETIWNDMNFNSIDLPKFLERAEDEITKASIFLQAI